MMQRIVCVLALISLTVSGCQQSDTVSVTGMVTMNGQPMENAEVFFNPKQGRMAFGVTDSSGHFSLSTAKPGDGAMPGEYSVTLTEHYPADKPPAMPKGGGLLPSRFPPKYGDPAKSPLNFTVERGKKNEFAIEVQK